MRIERNTEKCDNCLRCVNDCAATVWRNVDGEPSPVMTDLCNLCSHCLAVCKKNAIHHEVMDENQVRKINKKSIDPEIYREIVLTRRSIRHYKKKKVPRSEIEKILDLARYSPTASNSQNVGYIVVTDPSTMRKISRRIFGGATKFKNFLESKSGKRLTKPVAKTELMVQLGRYMEVFDYYKAQIAEGRDMILHNAPVLILVHAPSRASFSCDNCNIAAANITNYAHALGLGTCYIGFVTMALRYDPVLKKLLDIPRGRRVFASLVMGYPSLTHANTVSRKPTPVTWIDQADN